MMIRAFYGSLAGFTALIAFTFAASAADNSANKPVYILLYSRFYDHSHLHPLNERLQRLLPLVQRLHDKYPQYGFSALLQFSGTTSEVLAEENAANHLIDKVKDFAQRGLIDVGYTGEDEPSYLYRPRANVLLADTAAARWSAIAEAEKKFLVDFKDPVTGKPVPGLTGGLKRTQEVFGPVAFVSGLTPTTVSGDAEAVHELRTLNEKAVLTGVRVNDPRLGIEGYRVSGVSFAKFVSPDPSTSPEVYWEDGTLRLSDVSLPDNTIHSTDQGLDAIKAAFAKLDRSRARVLKIEVVSYPRYLAKRPDGTVKWDPMEWLYYHPDEPKMPLTLNALVDQSKVEDAYKKEEQTLDWLLNDFLPANPGSRFISVRELKSMAPNPIGTEVSQAELGDAASDLVARFRERPMEVPNFARCGDKFFSLADSFQLLAQALAAADKNGSLPDSVRLSRIYGPLVIPNDMGPTSGSVIVADVLHAAAQIAGPLANDTWKEVPDNAVPVSIMVGKTRVNGGQFLRLMAQAYLDPAKDKTLNLNAVQMFSAAAFMYPKNTMMLDQGNTWTFRPAPLRLIAAGSQASN